MRHLFAALFAVTLAGQGFAQPPAIEWQRCIGGNDYDGASNIIPVGDGGYVLAGATASNILAPLGIIGGYDMWVSKVSDTGALIWSNTYGGHFDDVANYMERTADSGYIIAGYTESNDEDVSGNHGMKDGWLVKLDSNRNIQWQKCFGSSKDDNGLFVHQTADGGYLFAENIEGGDGDVLGYHDSMDIRLIKVNDTGGVVWQRCYGGSGNDQLFMVYPTQDGNFMVSAISTIADGDVTTAPGSRVFKIDAQNQGDILWQQGIAANEGKIYYVYLCQLADGGYIITAVTADSTGYFTGNHGPGDIWVARLNNEGNILWHHCFGGSGTESPVSIILDADSNIIISGVTTSNDGDVTGYHAPPLPVYLDVWVLSLGMNGNLNWQKCLGGFQDEYGAQIITTPDGGYLISCVTESNDGDVTNNHGQSDAWLVKLAAPLAVADAKHNQKAALLYPTVTSNGVVYLQLSDEWMQPQIRVADQLGRNIPVSVTKTAATTWQVSLPGSASGAYILSAWEQASKIAIKRFFCQ